MSNAKPLDLSLPYQVADISLADFGKKEMQLSEREMPGLMELIRRYGDKKPLKGFKVMGSLHMTIQTAMLIKTLYELGADIRWASCNIFSPQDHAASGFAPLRASRTVWTTTRRPRTGRRAAASASSISRSRS